MKHNNIAKIMHRGTITHY